MSNNDDKCLDNMLEIVYTDYVRLKKLYRQACRDKKTQFKFMQHDLLTSYAKYLIQYIEMKTNWGYTGK